MSNDDLPSTAGLKQDTLNVMKIFAWDISELPVLECEIGCALAAISYAVVLAKMQKRELRAELVNAWRDRMFDHILDELNAWLDRRFDHILDELYITKASVNGLKADLK